VTIGGESAGGMSVACLLSSPKAKGLFRGAIMQSGAGHHAVTRDNAKLITGELAKRLGVEPTREAIANVPIEQILDAQIDMSAEIQEMPDPARWGEMVLSMMAFQPVVDGEVLPKLPIRSIEGGAGADVNVLIGANTDENLLFMAPSGALGAIDADMLTGAAMGYGLSEEALAIYRANRPDASPGEVLAALATDWMFRIPAIRVAEARAESAGNTYVYEFAWRSTARDGILGACHALEIPFAFDTLDAEETTWITGEAPPQLLADEMHRAWVRFISEGEPGWEEYGEARTTMRFDEEPQVVTDLRPDERVAWNGVR
jgi:para-nitrobenzyl esterase